MERERAQAGGVEESEARLKATDQGETMSQTPVRRVLIGMARLLGMVGGLGLTAAVILSPSLMRNPLDQVATVDSPPRSREFVQAELSDLWASREFVDLAKVVAAMPEAPTWENVHDLMKAQGWTKVRYAVRLCWLLDDGASGDMISLRTPYEEPWNDWEFLPLLRNRPESIEFHLIDGQQMLARGPEERIAEEFVKLTAPQGNAMETVTKRREGGESGRPR